MREKVNITAVIALAVVAVATATEKELKWDTGTPAGSALCQNAGADFWFANDFDVSTLKLRRVGSLRIMCCREPGWNDDVSGSKPHRVDSLITTGFGDLVGGGDGRGWDGFRIAIFDFSSRTPGSIIWPTSGAPKFVKPSGPSRYVWCEFHVGWTLPEGTNAFAAGQEQFFVPPDCDLFAFDDDIGHRGHTWQKFPRRSWIRHAGFPSCNNFILRVILTGEVSVRPTSFGRVRALYR